MHRAVLARALFIAEPAVLQPQAGIVGEPAVFLRHAFQPKFPSAVQLHHQPNSAFLAFYPAHRRVFGAPAHIRSGTSIPRSAMPLRIIFATFLASTSLVRRVCPSPAFSTL